jgi:hexokinase
MIPNSLDFLSSFFAGNFFTRYASEIESDPVGEYNRARMALQELEINPDEVTTEDYSSLRYVCEMVSRRASFMASAGITALLKKMDYKDVVIAIDGSLFRSVLLLFFVKKSSLLNLLSRRRPPNLYS